MSITIPFFRQLRGHREGYRYFVAANDDDPAPAPSPLLGGSGQRRAGRPAPAPPSLFGGSWRRRLSLVTTTLDLFAACHCGGVLVLATTRVKADVANYGGGGPSAFFTSAWPAFTFSSFWWSSFLWSSGSK